MGFTKSFQEGPFQINASEGNGALELDATMSASVGGGQAAGVVQVQNVTKIVISDKQLVAIVFGYFASKFPSIAVIINSAGEAIAALL